MTWGDGNAVKRAPPTCAEGARFPTTRAQLMRITTFAVRENQ